MEWKVEQFRRELGEPHAVVVACICSLKGQTSGLLMLAPQYPTVI